MTDSVDKFKQCTWSHHIESPILVYDRDFYEKYGSGEYELPKRCICGALIDYAEPICICLVEQGNMTGEMIVKLPIPLTHIQLNLVTDVAVPSCETRGKVSPISVCYSNTAHEPPLVPDEVVIDEHCQGKDR